MSKNSAYPSKHGANLSKHVHLYKIFHKEKYLSMEKVIPMAKFTNYKSVFQKKRPTRVLISLVSLTYLKENLPAEKRYTDE